MATYACIKDGSVSNMIIIEEFSEELVSLIKEDHGYDDVIEASHRVEIGYTFDGTNFSDPNATNEDTTSEFNPEVESAPGFTDSETPPNLNEL